MITTWILIIYRLSGLPTSWPEPSLQPYPLWFSCSTLCFLNKHTWLPRLHTVPQTQTASVPSSPEHSPELMSAWIGLSFLTLSPVYLPSLEKKPWCWKRLKAEGEGGERGWDGPSPTQWTWTGAISRRYWRTEKPGVLQSMGLKRAGHDWATEQQPD